MIELQVASGSNRGEIFRPSSETFGVGRASDNFVLIRNSHVSGHHGVVQKRSKEYFYQDLGSTNGTLVKRKTGETYLNRNTQLEIALRDGDQLILGAVPHLVAIHVRIWSEEEPKPDGSSAVLASCSVKELPRIDSSVKRDHDTLIELYNFMKKMQALNDSREVLDALCSSVFEMLAQASHLSLIRWDSKKGEYDRVFSRIRNGGRGSDEFRLSRSIIHRVIEKEEALLFQDAARDLADSESVLAAKILSSICVPLWNEEGIQGLLQVDNRESGGMFQPRDMEILTVLGNHTANVLGRIHLFENLRETLRKLELMELAKCHMSKFVPPSVRKIIEADPEGMRPDRAEKCVTVMFLDICGYTKMSEAMDYQSLSRIIEDYFSLYLDEISEKNGDINETAGDGLMVIFQAERHARDAVQAAMQIQQRTVEVNFQRRGEQDPVYVNIGINTGSAYVGLAHFEGFSGARWTYTATGTTTNLAARMASHAVNGQIIIGEGTAEQVGNELPLIDMGKVGLKNVSQPVQIYQVAF